MLGLLVVVEATGALEGLGAAIDSAVVGLDVLHLGVGLQLVFLPLPLGLEGPDDLALGLVVLEYLVLVECVESVEVVPGVGPDAPVDLELLDGRGRPRDGLLPSGVLLPLAFCLLPPLLLLLAYLLPPLLLYLLDLVLHVQLDGLELGLLLVLLLLVELPLLLLDQLLEQHPLRDWVGLLLLRGIWI